MYIYAIDIISGINIYKYINDSLHTFIHIVNVFITTCLTPLKINSEALPIDRNKCLFVDMISMADWILLLFTNRERRRCLPCICKFAFSLLCKTRAIYSTLHPPPRLREHLERRRRWVVFDVHKPDPCSMPNLSLAPMSKWVLRSVYTRRAVLLLLFFLEFFKVLIMPNAFLFLAAAAAAFCLL